MTKLHDEKSLWSDSDLQCELEEITREILTRIEREAVADGNIEIIHAPFKSKKKKDTKYWETNTNGDTIRVFFDSDNVIDRLKSIRAVTGFSLYYDGEVDGILSTKNEFIKYIIKDENGKIIFEHTYT